MADHIQIGDISPRIQYTGDGTQTVFTYPFPIFKDADIEAYEGSNLKVLTTDYTVSGAGTSTGGTVIFVVAPINGATVTLRRNIAIARTSDFQESGEFRAKVINDELDTLTAGLQQVETDVGRALTLSPIDSANSTSLPDKASRSSKVLGFDVNGDPVASTKNMSDLETEADAAAASATAAAGSSATASTSAANAATSETNAGTSETNAAASELAAAASAAMGLYKQIQVKSAAYTVVVGDEGDLIKVDASGGAVTITLDTLATIGVDFRCAIAKSDATANAVTVQRSSTDTINGTTSITLTDQYELWDFVGDTSTGLWLGINASTAGISGGNGIDKTGGVVSVDLDADPGLEFNAGKLRTKVDGTSLERVAGGLGVKALGVGTAELADDAVTLAKIAAGTDGELITWDAAGNPAVVATGTAAQVLTSNGAGAAPTFQAAGGAWNLIGTAIASASPDLTVTGLDFITYRKFVVIGTDLKPATDDVIGYIRLGDSVGVDSGASDYCTWGIWQSETMSSAYGTAYARAQYKSGNNLSHIKTTEYGATHGVGNAAGEFMHMEFSILGGEGNNFPSVHG
ncbi:MAG: hypothetical protein HQ504_02075, partial [Rhodospirillaceae bacterium]|nr:hypothetical protein [Rhodospirillaceae bacterium]